MAIPRAAVFSTFPEIPPLSVHLGKLGQLPQYRHQKFCNLVLPSNLPFPDSALGRKVPFWQPCFYILQKYKPSGLRAGPALSTHNSQFFHKEKEKHRCSAGGSLGSQDAPAPALWPIPMCLDEMIRFPPFLLLCGV